MAGSELLRQALGSEVIRVFAAAAPFFGFLGGLQAFQPVVTDSKVIPVEETLEVFPAGAEIRGRETGDESHTETADLEISPPLLPKNGPENTRGVKAKARKRGNISFLGKDFPQLVFSILLQDALETLSWFHFFFVGDFYSPPPPSLPSLSRSPGHPDSGGIDSRQGHRQEQ